MLCRSCVYFFFCSDVFVVIKYEFHYSCLLIFIDFAVVLFVYIVVSDFVVVIVVVAAMMLLFVCLLLFA